MYVPPFNKMPSENVRDFVRAIGGAELITTGDDGYPRATLLPIVWAGDRVIAHLARANDHWRQIAPDSPALVVCRGDQAYVSPSWYDAKAEHHRVVPTWNYSTVHLTGRATVHDDVEWVRRAVTLLTDQEESGRPDPWAVTDAPAAFIDGQLRGIVGVEVIVEQVSAKAKLSQNRSLADRTGVVAGLADEPSAQARAMAETMRGQLPT